MKNIKNMSLKELLQASVEIERAKAAAEQKERGRVLAEAEKLAAAAGYTLADVFNVPRKKRRAKKPRIVNPSDKTQSYSGLGRKPAWLKQLEGNHA